MNNRSFQTSQIRGMGHTSCQPYLYSYVYMQYLSKCQDHSIKSKGVHEQRIIERRHCEVQYINAGGPTQFQITLMDSGINKQKMQC